MKRFLISLVAYAWLTLGSILAQTPPRASIQGDCTQGGQSVTTSGMNSTTKVQRSYPLCTATAYISGSSGVASGHYTSGGTITGNVGQTCNLAFTGGGGAGATASVALTSTDTIAAGTVLTILLHGNGYTSAPTAATLSDGTASCSGTAVVTSTIGPVKATLYSNDSGTSVSNPITSDATGHWQFWADPGRYDVTLSGGGIAAAFTRYAIPIFDERRVVVDPTDSKYGAKGNGVANDTFAFQAAITAINSQGGGTLSIPCGTYLLKGTGTELLLFDKPLRFIGGGPNCTQFVVDSSVGATTDIFHIKPTSDDPWITVPWLFEGFKITTADTIAAAGSVPANKRGRDAFRFDGAGGTVYYGPNTVTLHHVTVQPVVYQAVINGWAFNTVGLTHNFQAIGHIYDCILGGGINLSNVTADSWLIDHNQLTGDNPLVQIESEAGAAENVILANNMTCGLGGCVIVVKGTLPKILYNTMEQVRPLSNTNQAMIDFQGVTDFSSIVRMPEVVGNNINAMNTTANSINIRLGVTYWAHVEHNLIDFSSAGVGIYIDNHSLNAVIGQQEMVNIVGTGTPIINNGSRTDFKNFQEVGGAGTGGTIPANVLNAPSVDQPALTVKAYSASQTAHVQEWYGTGTLKAFISPAGDIWDKDIYAYYDAIHYMHLLSDSLGNGYVRTTSGVLFEDTPLLNNSLAVYDLSGTPITYSYIRGDAAMGINASTAEWILNNATGLATVNGLTVTVGSGSFTLAAAATKTVNNIYAAVGCYLIPSNAPAATLMGSSKSLYISAVSVGVSFTVATADGTNAAGTEVFHYVCVGN